MSQFLTADSHCLRLSSHLCICAHRRMSFNSLYYVLGEYSLCFKGLASHRYSKCIYDDTHGRGRITWHSNATQQIFIQGQQSTSLITRGAWSDLVSSKKLSFDLFLCNIGLHSQNSITTCLSDIIDDQKAGSIIYVRRPGTERQGRAASSLP